MEITKLQNRAYKIKIDKLILIVLWVLLSQNASTIFKNWQLCWRSKTYRIIVIPENVCRWFWTVSHDAGEVYGAASINEELRSADDLSVWLCNPGKKGQCYYYLTLNVYLLFPAAKSR